MLCCILILPKEERNILSSCLSILCPTGARVNTFFGAGVKCSFYQDRVILDKVDKFVLLKKGSRKCLACARKGQFVASASFFPIFSVLYHKSVT